MRPCRLLALTATCLLVTSQSRAEPVHQSVYSDLGGHRCKLVSVQQEGANSVQSCPGVEGYRLLVLDSDSRMSVTVVDPSGHPSPLDFWTVVTRGFSSLGPRAEWRLTRSGSTTSPVALIVRVNASAESDAERAASYLAVVRISGERTCVVTRIPASANANEEARKAADEAASMPCLEQLQ